MKVTNNKDTVAVDCPHCESELEVEYGDIEGGHVFGHGTSIYVYCGACGDRINLEYNKMPSHWQRWIDEADPDYD